jgi:hypothetical protein
MNTPRAHHYVPQFYLQGFTDMTRAKKPVLWVYEKQKPTRRSTPTESGHQRDFYAFQDKDGTKNFEVENLLSQLEGTVAPLVHDAEPSEILRRKAIFAIFVALTQQRVPAARKYTRQVMRQMVEAFRKESPSASVWREFLQHAAQIQGIGPFDDQSLNGSDPTKDRGSLQRLKSCNSRSARSFGTQNFYLRRAGSYAHRLCSRWSLPITLRTP